MNDRLPRWAVPAVVVLSVLGLLPFAFAAKTRVTRGPSPRIQVIPDMDQQPRFEAQQAHPLFADGRAMRPPVDGAVARGELNADDRVMKGKDGDAWVEVFPVEVTADLMERGRERFGIFCAACHGLGVGGVEVRGEVKSTSMVDARALASMETQAGTWTPPTSFHSEDVVKRPIGHMYNTVTNGIRSMPGYASQIPMNDRWAIVLYLRALQRSQNARISDVPEDLRGSLR